MQSKTAFSMPLFLLGSLTLLGCATGQPQPPPPPPHAGTLVRVACPSHWLARLIDKHSKGWQGRQKAQVQVVCFQPPQGPDQTEPCDVWLLPASELARWLSVDRLRPLPESYLSPDRALGWMGLLPLYRDQLLLWRGTVYALPLVGDAPLCYYRSDQFDDPEHQTAFLKREKRPLRPPLTWDDFERVAAYFAQTGKPSLPPLPADDEDLDLEFHSLAAAYACRAVPEDETVAAEQRAAVFSFHYDLQTGKPRIDSPGFVHALQLLQRLQKFRPRQEGSPREAFQRGEAVLCLGQAWFVEQFQKGRESKVRDRFGLCRIPGGEGYYATTGGMHSAASGVNVMPYLGTGAWLAAVPRDAANPDAAFDLLADLASRESSNQVVLDVSRESVWAGGAIRQDQLEERARWEAFDLDQRRTSEMKDGLRQTLIHRGLKNPVLCLRTPASREHRRLLLEEVRSAVQSGTNAQEALSRVAERWSVLDQQRGVDKVLEEYRISLGLLAQ